MATGVIAGKKSNFAVRLLKPLMKDSTLAVGAAILLIFILLSVLAPWIAVIPPDQQDLMASLEPSSGTHWFGTDELGRDIFSRVIYASRTDLTIAIGGVLLAYVVALPLGLSAGYYGGRIDRAISTVSESILTFPSLVLSIIIVSMIGSGQLGLIITITVTQAPQLVRYLRGFVLQIREMEYISAAKAAGSKTFYIMTKHILRNIMGPSLVVLSLLASEAVLVAAALGFLGLGVQPPAPEWGTMLSRSRSYFMEAPHLMIYPGLAIALLILGFNLLGDGMRDLLDAKKR
ncbi:ABC transporter permease [Paenibacillus thalictri]|uniref:ABC transporter permease n=1 Tax=Paenibacillus thalictri TaxID=2527873 RepID=A0A4Q9DQE0_9BACL|nr:ABC transporter permease [Paenibacillus thalictri]TBL75623.1 ABC transporter permease [Paenibacillus thalictri]